MSEIAQLDDRTSHVRRWDNDRFVCSLFAPADRRAALTILYAFNLEISLIRERTREPMVGRIRLQWWREAVDEMFDGGHARHPVLVSLAEVASRFALDRSPFEDILSARERDFDDAPPQSMEELIAYAEGTSAALAVLALMVVGADTPANRAAARGVGIAWALTGLMRALPFHMRAQRIWLPVSVMEAVGFDPSHVGRPRANDALRKAVASVAERADAFVCEARRQDNVSSEALPVLLWATLADGYLRRLRKAGCDPFSGRVQRRVPSQLIALAVNRARKRF